MDTVIDKYISKFDLGTQERLGKIRGICQKCLPNAEQGFKYGVPAFYLEEILIVYAAYKNHIGFYPTPEIIEKFKDELKEYKHAKGSIQFPHGEPLPLKVIEKMAKARYHNYIKKDSKWK